MKLILFDIDGTLVDCGGQARRAFATALARVAGTTAGIETYDFSGKLDPRIVMDLLAGAGFERDRAVSILPRVRETYLEELERTLDPGRMRTMPGIGDLLAHLEARDDIALALLTGNWEQGGRIKLSRFDLNRFFPFGGFGDDGYERHELPPVAWNRAQQILGRRFSPDETLIVGDSLLDISCAQAHGIPCLAVATGRTSREVLAGARATWVEDDLATAIDHVAFA